MLIRRNQRLLVTYALLASLWLLLFHSCRLYTYSDPSSLFYDPQRAYQTRYTEIREQQADSLLKQASNISGDELWGLPLIDNNSVTTSQPPEKQLCIGIPSIRREREQFLPRTIASLVEGLSFQQRNAIHIKVLLADQDPTTHPAFGQPWLDRLADEILFYGDASLPGASDKYHKVSPKILDQVQEISRNERVHRDYSTLMAPCRARGADYFILIEDDIIAASHWLRRLWSGLTTLESTDDPRNWLYIRLFYSETYLGWNSEEWPTYLVHSLLIYGGVLLLYLVATTIDLRRRSQSLHPKSNCRNFLHVTFWTASFIALYFLAGRLTVEPYPDGVQEMPNYGCCAQGLVIPHQHLDPLEATLKAAPHALAGDTVIEGFADERGLRKYAIIPSVLQHIGVKGSSDAVGSKKATWNFRFERIDTGKSP